MKKSRVIYLIIKYLVWLFYPRIEVEGLENLPDEPSVIVGNHSQMHGPIACELYFPGEKKIWCAGQMMEFKEVPKYAFQDFWSQKPGYIRWFFKGLSYVIAPLAVIVFNNADTIAAYKDTRIISTFRSTMSSLEEGDNVIIFPEHDVSRNRILCDFQPGFVDVARLYYKKTGKELSFVPMYLAPYLKKMIFGKPIQFRADLPAREERDRICGYLMEEITSIACELPEHKVVPYRNVPKKLYPSNRSTEEKQE